MVYSKIAGVGAYVPEKVLTNHDLEKMVDTNDEWIRTRTGIEERRISEGEPNSTIATRAANKALQQAGVNAEDVDMIMIATISPDYHCPATACFVRNKIGANHAAAFDLAAGCTGLIYGLKIGDAFIRSGMYKNILVIGCEVLSSITNWEDRNTCILFGDGGAAVLLSAAEKPGIIDSYIQADSTEAMNLYTPAGGSVLPLTPELVEQKQDKLFMNGKVIFKQGVLLMTQAGKLVLERNNLKPDDINWVIPHQANIRIIRSMSNKIGIGMDKFVVNLNKYGNTSAASIGLALDEAIRDGRIQRGQKILLTAVGAGLTWGSLLFDY